MPYAGTGESGAERVRGRACGAGRAGAVGGGLGRLVACLNVPRRRLEKLHEELLISSDMLTTPHHKILRAQESYLSEFEIATAMKDLRNAIAATDEDMAHGIIARWVEHGEKDAEATEAKRL